MTTDQDRAAAAFARATDVLKDRSVPASWRAPYFDQSITPGVMALVFATAAQLIDQRGYNSHYRYPNTPGPLSMMAAVREAAMITRPPAGEVTEYAATELSEECAGRLGGFLYMTGQRYSTVANGDINGAPEAWDDDRGRVIGPQAPGTYCLPVQLLAAAAAFMLAMDHS